MSLQKNLFKTWFKTKSNTLPKTAIRRRQVVHVHFVAISARNCLQAFVAQKARHCSAACSIRCQEFNVNLLARLYLWSFSSHLIISASTPLDGNFFNSRERFESSERCFFVLQRDSRVDLVRISLLAFQNKSTDKWWQIPKKSKPEESFTLFFPSRSVTHDGRHD